jgi:predicted DNA-binding transcriptional regulator AlpA
MSVEATSADVAISKTRGVLLTALHRVGFPGSPEIARIQVETVEQLARSLAEPNIPELAGVAEVSKMLRVSKQRVSELLKGNRFPRPITVLEASPVWRSTTILRFAQEWERKPGRPAKVAARYAEKPGR